MTIAVGDRLPDISFRWVGLDGPEDRSTAELFAGKKVALFGVPGAFTPTCSNKHLPGFLEKAAEFGQRGVDLIVCVSVNDMHVMNAWANATGAREAIFFMPDVLGDFTRAIGLETDASQATLGPRLRRCSMVVDDGVVKALNIEDASGQAIKTSAEALLAAL